MTDKTLREKVAQVLLPAYPSDGMLTIADYVDALAERVGDLESRDSTCSKLHDKAHERLDRLEEDAGLDEQVDIQSVSGPLELPRWLTDTFGRHPEYTRGTVEVACRAWAKREVERVEIASEKVTKIYNRNYGILQTERDELKEELWCVAVSRDSWQTQSRTHAKELADLIGERDELKAELKTCKITAGDLERAFSEVCIERDEANTRARTLKAELEAAVRKAMGGVE